jgi:transketolase
MTYEDLLVQIARKNDRLVVMTAEDRVAIRGLPPRIGSRFIDVGIAEMTLIGAAAGLALRGRIPVVHAPATFLTLRAFEFARTDVGIGNLPVKLVGGVPGFLSDANGPAHQAIEDIALMRGIPSMNVFCPADAVELVAGMPHVIEHGSPWYVRYNAGPAAVPHPVPFAIGKAEQLTAGRDVTILAFGYLLREAYGAATLLAERGVGVRLVNLRTLKPIDEEAVLNAAAETRLLVTVEDHFETGGLTSIVAELLVRHRTTAKVLPIALPNRWFKPALLRDVLEYEGFTGARIADRIAEAVQV